MGVLVIVGDEDLVGVTGGVLLGVLEIVRLGVGFGVLDTNTGVCN